MKNAIRAGLLTGVLWLSAAGNAFAAPAAIIQALQSPAWLDRDTLTVPLQYGTELRPGDQLRTGKGGRLLLAFPEGSVVKLGENATFQIARAETAAGGIFRAGLRVLQGAFRFTTAPFARSRGRDVEISVGRNATIGIRGTDLWGRGRDDKDIVCLIEGKIEVKGNDGKSATLDQPLQFFEAPNGAPPLPVTFIEQKQLDAFALETEVEGQGAAAKDHVWRVVLKGFAARAEMLQAKRRLAADGFPVEAGPGDSLRIAGLASQTAALVLGNSIRGKYGAAETFAERGDVK